MKSRDAPTVEGLFTAPRAGEPMQARRTVQLISGIGISGDRYALKLGHWSDPRWPDQELTLVEAELLEELSLEPPDLRRNIVTRGIELQTLIGREFVVGQAALAGVRPCDPCLYIESLTRTGLFRELRGRGGLRARILKGGAITIGDVLRLTDRMMTTTGTRPADTDRRIGHGDGCPG